MKQWMTTAAVAAALLTITAQLATAQPEGGGRRGGGRFGMGMGGPGVLLEMKEVQTELKLNEEDVKKIREKLAELRPQRGEGGGFRDFQDLNEEEREKRMGEFRKRMEETSQKVDAMLKENLTADQYKRLSELRLQREGAASLDRAEIAEDLKLTTDQKDKIKKLVAENRPRFGQRRGGGEGGPPDREEMQKRVEKFRTDVLAVLTEEQKSAWEKLQGAKFDFPVPQFGGGPGGERRRNRPAAE